MEEHFGKTGGVVITFLYFFAICPLLWIYGVTITNTFMTFWENQLQMPALNRGVVALLLLLLMAFVIWFGKDLMVKVMSYLVWPFIASPVVISLSLIPYWNSAVIDRGQPQRYRLNRSRRHSGDGMAGHLHHGVLLQLLADRLLVCGLQTRRV